MINLQEPSRPWEIAHMHWVTGLPPGDDRIYNSYLVIVGRFSKTSIFFLCHRDDTAIDTALPIWDRVVSWTGILTNILAFSTTYHPLIDGLAERMTQTLEDMVRRFCAYGLDLKDSD
ncbi:hypothetical protein O181_000516 [Austropuccinia psidii MF-1]|uniref:Integrase catalytic domain-containing protein n=1 Tax=Austropuccinia psidii MF-1 TaxID=1389203 RepID=A0A9Q3B8P2_9BASI|nr:hypothetical protein [Austropuccinia psidii MF-1]